MSNWLTTTGVAGSILMTGCASIVSGQNQSLSVQTATTTDPVSGASCTLSNDKGTWYVTTPGSTVVRRSYSDLSINCQKEEFVADVTSIKSTTKGMAFGNILFGGVIGAGVDIATGAAYDYPTDISITMVRLVDDSAAAKAKVDHSASGSQIAPSVLKPQGGFIEYRIVNRVSKSQRTVRLSADSPGHQGTGDLEVLAPPQGWVPASLTVGQRWTLKYTARDGLPASHIAIEGQVGSTMPLIISAGEFETVPIRYTGWVERESGSMSVSLPAEFQIWIDKKSRRVLKFESDIKSRSAGPNQVSGSQESVELAVNTGVAVR